MVPWGRGFKSWKGRVHWRKVRVGVNLFLVLTLSLRVTKVTEDGGRRLGSALEAARCGLNLCQKLPDAGVVPMVLHHS